MLFGGSDIGIQGFAGWGGWELAGLREKHSRQRHGVQSVTCHLPWKGPFRRANHSLDAYSYKEAFV